MPADPALAPTQALPVLLTVQALLSATVTLALTVPGSPGLRRMGRRLARRIALAAAALLFTLSTAAFAAWTEVAGPTWDQGAASQVVLIGLLVGIVAQPFIVTGLVAIVVRKR